MLYVASRKYLLSVHKQKEDYIAVTKARIFKRHKIKVKNVFLVDSTIKVIKKNKNK